MPCEQDSLCRQIATPASVSPVEVEGVAGRVEVLPNPTMGQVQVVYRLAAAGDVTAEISHVGGRLVRRLDLGRQSAGKQEFEWNGADRTGHRVPAGVYFLTLRSGTWRSR